MPDLEYHVQQQGIHVTTVIKTSFDEAVKQATHLLSDSAVKKVYIDVVTWTREAAVEYGGDAAGEVYDEDLDASVHDRIECTLNDAGKVSLNHQGRVA